MSRFQAFVLLKRGLPYTILKKILSEYLWCVNKQFFQPILFFPKYDLGTSEIGPSIVLWMKIIFLSNYDTTLLENCLHTTNPDI